MPEPRRPEPDPPYTLEQIQVLEAAEAVRRRPSMYIGALNDPDAVNRLIQGTLCLAMEEACSGRCRSIAIRLHDDGSATVEDDGSGLSLDPVPGYPTFAERLMTRLHACRDDKEHEEIAHYCCSTSLAAINALCSRLRVVVRRDGESWLQEYREGRPLGPFARIGIAERSGTTLSLMPDPSIFPHPAFDAPALQRWLVGLPPSVRTGPRIELIDERSGTSWTLPTA